MGRKPRVTPTRQIAVVLTEAQFFKLAKLSQDVQLAKHEAGAVLIRAKQAVVEKEAARNVYMDALTKTYPALDFKATIYSGDDATCTLTPQEKKP